MSWPKNVTFVALLIGVVAMSGSPQPVVGGSPRSASAGNEQADSNSAGSVAGCGDPATTTEIDLRALYPKEPTADGWKVVGEIALFNKDNLFDLINGESEMYFPYGFVQAASATFQNDAMAELTIQADIYQMGSQLDAFGIYSNYREPTSDYVRIGCGGFVADSQVMFYRFDQFYRLTAVGSPGDTRKHLLACAKTFDLHPDSLRLCPLDLYLLQVEGIIPRSITYVAESLLGYQFLPKGFLAKYQVADKQLRVFAAMFPDEDDANHGYQKYQEYLTGYQAIPEPITTSETETFTALDPLHKRVVVTHSGKYVFGVLGVTKPVEAEFVLSQMTKKDQLLPTGGGSILLEWVG
ncbi:MAG: hypothetical protein HYV26_17715 [Candidatus Hydrogenedentes bacterium]|nr:hypothetical protein [Candidatus Hydrogenedentota bacterium]